MSSIPHLLMLWLLMILPMKAMADSTQDYERQLLEQRIKPLGQVNISGNYRDNFQPSKAISVSNAKVPKMSSGMAIYNQYCVVCHGSGVAGAPKVHDQQDWGPRLKKDGVDGLVKSALSGVNAMPVKGTCIECTAAQLKAAIEYMIAKS